MNATITVAPSRALRLLAISLALSALTGCYEVDLTAAHAPPPGASASIDYEEQHIDLSAGTALAIECTINGSRRCEDMDVSVDDDSVVTVYRMHLDGMQSDYWTGEAERSGFALVGLRPGRVTLDVRTDEADASYTVEITAD